MHVSPGKGCPEMLRILHLEITEWNFTDPEQLDLTLG